jgi:predicted metal-dependent peptidase
MTQEREALDEAITNMAVKTTPFHKEYVYYLHLISQCKVVFSKSLPAAAGVSFNKDHYVLYLNPLEVIGISKDKKGNPEPILGFSTKMPLEQRIGILKHEMLHIILGHILRVNDRDFDKFNIASDCALDQEIKKEHLPSYAIYPDNNFPAKTQPKWGLTSEQYYDLIEQDELDKMNKEEEKSDDGNGFGPPKLTNGVGDHTKWLESEGDPDLQKEITKNMAEKAGEQTIKSAGTLPSNYAQIIENLSIRREVDWRQVLRRIVGNKKANIKKTLMRRDRRMPFANWIKGKTKDRVFELAVISDVSGSVSDKALYNLWGEIISICEMFNTPVNMVQVDTQPTKPEKLTKQSRAVTRKACGGTTLAPAIEMLKETKTPFDALVVTTDGYLFDDDIQPFKDLNRPVIWLIEEDGKVMDEMNQGKMRAIKLKKDD